MNNLIGSAARVEVTPSSYSYFTYTIIHIYTIFIHIMVIHFKILLYQITSFLTQGRDSNLTQRVYLIGASDNHHTYIKHVY